LDRGDIDHQNRRLAQLLRGGSAATYGLANSGFAINDGTTDTPQLFEDIGTRYDVTRGWSAFCSIRPDNVSADTTVPFFKRRDQPYGAGNSGWSFTGGPGNTYQVRISDGASQITVQSTTVQNTAVMHFICATYDRVNLKLFVNGNLEATTASAIAVGNNTGEPIKYLGLGPPAAELFFDGEMTVGIMWSRALSGAEVALLNTDPYIMWRHEPDDGLFAELEIANPNIGDKNCPWSMLGHAMNTIMSG
jgi:hypothetical protein